jgi:YegS/Rv2252/BmrU family lipid kinase
VARQAGEAIRLATEVVSKHARIVAVGGDGTVREVATGILQTENADRALGIVPLGTGNDIARSLGILSPSDALNALVTGRTRRIDAIRIDCLVRGQPQPQLALSMASVGITGELLRRTTPTVKRVFGPRLAYYIGLLRALWHYHSSDLTLAWEDQSTQGRFLFVGASNTEYSGAAMRLAPGAHVNDGLLAVNLIDEVGRWEACRQLRRLAHGQHTEHPRVRYFPTSELSVEARPPISVEADGELVGTTPARFRVLPDALSVLAP